MLIRDPRKAIESHYLVNARVTSEEIGYDSLFAVWKKLHQLGKAPMIIDADDLEEDPKGVLNEYCKGVGLEYDPKVLSWSPGKQTGWDIWEKWHTAASNSTAIFRNNKYNNRGLFLKVPNKDRQRLLGYYNFHLPYYRHLSNKI